MGRFGLTSLGHGAFIGIGAYVTVLLWNYVGLTPWIGIPVALVLRGHRRRAGRLSLLPLADHRPLLRAGDAGADRVRAPVHRRPARLHRRLARHPAARATATASRSTRCSSSPTACSPSTSCFALWLLGLYVWLRVDRSMDRYALDAASQDEDAAASVGIDVTREKLKITALSAAHVRARRRACSRSTRCTSAPRPSPASASRSTWCSPSSPAACGCCSGRRSAPSSPWCWPRACASPSRARRRCKSLFGSSALALDQLIYGLLLVLFIIYMPKGILGTGTDWWRRWRGRKAGAGQAKRRPSIANRGLACVGSSLTLDPTYPAAVQPFFRPRSDCCNLCRIRQRNVARAHRPRSSMARAAWQRPGSCEACTWVGVCFA